MRLRKPILEVVGAVRFLLRTFGWLLRARFHFADDALQAKDPFREYLTARDTTGRARKDARRRSAD